MSDENDEEFDFEKYLSSIGSKKPEGKFLTHVSAQDLDEQGRFICKEPVLIIGRRAFEDVCDKLTYAKIDGVISIEDEAFANCTKLEEADIGFELDYKYLQNYDKHMFWKDKVIDNEDDYEFALEKFCEKFGAYDVHIKDGAFNNCINLKKFHIPARVVLHGSPFRQCNSMTEITIDGSIHLRIQPKILEGLSEYETPFRAITFKDCNNVQKINFEKGVVFDIDEIAQFENLKEVNLSCSFRERRKFWKNAIATYPHFYFKLPTDLYNDKSFVRDCLYPVPEALEEIYGYPACKAIYKKMLQEKDRIEKEKFRKKLKNQRTKNPENGGGILRTR